MIVYTENPKEFIKKTQGYKINIYKCIAFLYVNNKLLKFEIKKLVAQKKIVITKYDRIYMPKTINV